VRLTVRVAVVVAILSVAEESRASVRARCSPSFVPGASLARSE